MMQTASALNSRTMRYVNFTMSGLPWVRVSASGALVREVIWQRRRRTVYDSSGRCVENGVHELIAESLTDVGRGPEEPYRYALSQDDRCTWSDATASRNEDDLAEESGDPEHAVARDTPHPEVGWRLRDLLGRPIPSLRDHERVPIHPGLRHRCKAVPLE